MDQIPLPSIRENLKNNNIMYLTDRLCRSSRHVSRKDDRSRGHPSDRRHRSRSEDRREHSKSPVPKKHATASKETNEYSSRRNKDSKGKRETSKVKQKKKKKRRSSSSDSSSSDSGGAGSEEELKLLQRLEAERQRLKEARRREKDLMKANETPEEKRARRLREKQQKELKRRQRMGWDGEYQCYTNQDNPFGDSALTSTFVWRAKLAREGVRNVSRDEIEAQSRQKQLENKIELEKVKQRRLEREAERGAREAEAAAAARAREAHQLEGWARQEDAFHLQQARLRTQIRIRDGRAKPIDLLAWYVSSEGCADALEMHEPYTYLNGLQQPDLEDLLEDIKVYKELEEQANHAYWRDVETIVLDELGKLRRGGAGGGGAAGGGAGARRDTVHQAVADDVTQVFRGKSGAQLAALQSQIESKISGRRDNIDIGYWESLLSQLKAHMARARLRDRHQSNLRRKLQLLKQEQGVAAVGGDPAPPTAAPPADREDEPEAGEEEQEEVEAEEGGEEWCVSQYRAGRYSPPPLSPRRLEPGAAVLEARDDQQRLAYLRARLHAPAAPPLAPPADTTHMAGSAEALELAARRSMGAAPDEAQFSVEYALERPPAPLWPDKYRPRKPRYFNRVHTGFEWNKYNQTHYDMDNPPPKIVQGYKFNIFYPDLIDPSSTPEFSLQPCAEGGGAGGGEFAVLRFHAGPPYEDIAFKIVNREWEYSYKRGFRCHFHNNIFQLWFHFKRYRYRR